MYEKKHHPLLTLRAYRERLWRHGTIALIATAISLLVGILGYRLTEGMGWLDALLNAAMILGGMGPVSALENPEAKIFASLYAIYCGFFLLICGGLLLAPVFHRILHHFHAE
ncbi:MAG: hypothetical protein ACK5WQ_06210 [Alphaproteobacteria bacterium]|jgi:hypothetical protein|nr:hypothetical protein [Rickettsiales bacterium]